LVRPRIVRRVDLNGHTQRIPAAVRRHVVSPAIAAQLTTILTQAVMYGTGQKAGLENYVVAGKTGTAQKVDPQRGGYSSRKVLASFVGFVPAQAPQFVMLVMLDEPQRLRWGGQAAAPVFRRIAQQALPYLQVPAGQGRHLSHYVSVERRLAQRRSDVGLSAASR
jgi:cell division protein FtsI/penicillin-binding protein 2